MVGKDATNFEIIKIDVQGAEYETLLGAENTIRRSDSIVVIEISIFPLNGPKATTFLDVSIIMDRYGYALFDVAHTSRVVIDDINNQEFISQMDMVWIRKDRFVGRFAWDIQPKWQCQRAAIGDE